MKVKYYYPAVFDKQEDGITVTFPDLPGIVTFGENSQEAFVNAKEALELHLYGLEKDKLDIKTADVTYKPKKECESVVLIEAYMPTVRMEMEYKAVKKTLTIPSWLNEAAESQGVNFSQLLQSALVDKLGLPVVPQKRSKRVG